MKRYLYTIAFLSIALILFSFGTLSINPDELIPPKTLTTKDKAAIRDIFKTIGERNFRLEFGTNEAYGSFVLQDAVVKALRSGTHIDIDILATSHFYKSYQPELAFWFYINRDRSEGLEGIFGKSNAAKLQAIIKKYSAGQ
ncbi:MAG TPA: hypothetical protein VF144_04475 [Chitinophagaceae bacterium]